MYQLHQLYPRWLQSISWYGPETLSLYWPREKALVRGMIPADTQPWVSIIRHHAVLHRSRQDAIYLKYRCTYSPFNNNIAAFYYGPHRLERLVQYSVASPVAAAQFDVLICRCSMKLYRNMKSTASSKIYVIPHLAHWKHVYFAPVIRNIVGYGNNTVQCNTVLRTTWQKKYRICVRN